MIVFYTIVYIIIAVMTALGISAYSARAAQWGARRCVVLGIFWWLSLPVIVGFMIRNKLRGTS